MAEAFKADGDGGNEAFCDQDLPFVPDGSQVSAGDVPWEVTSDYSDPLEACFY